MRDVSEDTQEKLRLAKLKPIVGHSQVFTRVKYEGIVGQVQAKDVDGKNHQRNKQDKQIFPGSFERAFSPALLGG